MKLVVEIFRGLVSGNSEDTAFLGMKLHLTLFFTVSEVVQILLEGSGIFFTCHGHIHDRVVSKEANFSTTSSGRSIMYMRKRTGPMTDPSGTPLRTEAHWECSPLHITLYDLPSRKSSIQLHNIGPVMP